MSRADGTVRQRHTSRCPRNTNPDGIPARGWAPHKCRGPWEWSLDVGADPLTGKRRQRTRGGYASRADAKAALDQMRATTTITQGRGEALTVRTWLDQWLLSRHDLEVSSRARHESAIRLHLTLILGRIKLTDLRPEHIDAYLVRVSDPGYQPPGRSGKYANATGLSTASINRTFDTLSAALGAAVKRRLIPWSPAVACTPPTEINRTGEAWSPAEVAAFLAHTRDDRWHAAWRLVLTTGARRGELAGARWVDVNLDSGQWWLSNSRVEVGGETIEKRPKSKRARMVILDGITAEILRAHRVTQAKELLRLGVPDTGYVLTTELGEPIRPHHLTVAWGRAVASSGLPVRTLHEGRHTAVTIGRVHAGVDAATMRERVGHASEHVADRYTHPHADVSRATAERIAGVIDGDGVRGVHATGGAG